MLFLYSFILLLPLLCSTAFTANSTTHFKDITAFKSSDECLANSECSSWVQAFSGNNDTDGNHSNIGLNVWACVRDPSVFTISLPMLYSLPH
uniref:ARAD1A00220p n=1 Tax=Blastobotrys adeninivorans TaxID=409370 RepID=A0A060T290_BLAAD